MPNTFILTWNPAQSDWPEPELDDLVAKTARGLRVPGQWSTGARRSLIQPGDRAFLFRQGPQRAIVGLGEFTSEVYQGRHWNGQGGTANFARLDWLRLVKYPTGIPIDVALTEVPSVPWNNMQGSGVLVSPADAVELLELWNRHVPLDGAAMPSNTPPAEPCSPQIIILHGPPGTGKTHSTVRRALEQIIGVEEVARMTELDRLARFGELQHGGQIEFVTFHQSYGYEEFVEGLRPVLNTAESGAVRYELHHGTFKRIALRAAAEGLLDDQSATAAEDAEPIATEQRVQSALDRPSSGAASFAFTSQTRQYVLIIDEINRGNVSKILGELITLLEPDKRLGARNELKLPLAYSPGHRFAVPPNLHVIGTMNTADRSIALMDVALRRRFTFEELMPKSKVIRDVLGGNSVQAALVDLTVEIFDTLNRRIRFLYDRDHQLGHAYFLQVASLEGLRGVMVDRIIPLLQEYFYGSWQKIAIVLGCPYDDQGHPAANSAPAKAYAAPLIRATLVSAEAALGFDHDEHESLLDFCVDPEFAQGEMSAESLARALLGVLNLPPEALAQRLRLLAPAAEPALAPAAATVG